LFDIIKLENGLENVKDFYCGATNVGMRLNEEQGDVAFISSTTLCDISAVFTSNTFQAAPIKHFQKYPKGFQTNFVLINAKNANAMTGKKGLQDIESIMSSLSTKQKVFNPVMASTGVIGYRLPMDKIVSAFDTLDFSVKNSHDTARAIMTTDSFKKELAYKVELEDGTSFNIAAICKGAGMINPAMATMLCFIITDADVPKSDMDELLSVSTEQSFNRISVDGDTSTNDTVMLLANKRSKNYDKVAFSEALNKIMFELAMLILKDGEGANKLVTFEIKGAKTLADAKTASIALSNSLLVKTALFGEDPNWGRIASTIGASGVACDDETLTIHYDDLLIYSSEFRELDKTREDKAYVIMKQDAFKVTCDLGVGNSHYISYGCDLSYEYVKINAEYRT
jgi:glutamate N-acetyltransferase/amino-acid N-acetyltransferase